MSLKTVIFIIAQLFIITMELVLPDTKTYSAFFEILFPIIGGFFALYVGFLSEKRGVSLGRFFLLSLLSMIGFSISWMLLLMLVALLTSKMVFVSYAFVWAIPLGIWSTGTFAVCALGPFNPKS